MGQLCQGGTNLEEADQELIGGHLSKRVCAILQKSEHPQSTFMAGIVQYMGM